MSEQVSSLRGLLQDLLERHRHKDFLEASMAACALAAAADGAVSFGERSRVDEVLESLGGLQAFDPHQGVEVFERYFRLLRDDPAGGREQAMAVIRRELEDEPERGPLLLHLCRSVGDPDPASGADPCRWIAELCSEPGAGD